MRLARRVAHRAAIAAVLACPLAALAADPDPAPRRPNFIVFFTDDHGWPDVGAQGVLPDLRTPNIDALAASGVRCTDGYATAPQCVPSRGGLLTGIHQNRFGLELNPDPLDGFNAQQTIADRLREAGYVTGMAGKWHLGPPAEIGQHGFDLFHHKHSGEPGIGNFDPATGEHTPVGAKLTRTYHIEEVAQAATTFIDQHHDQPFFFYAAWRAPHVPLDATPELLARFPGEMPERRRQALAMISAIDDGVGRVTSTLREHGLEDDTLIFFIGDNGAPLKMHKLDAPGGGPGWDGSVNDPLNGEKGMLSEGGIRVPYIVSWPGAIPAGTVFTHPVSTLDVGATLLAAAGAPVPAEFDGANLVPHLRGDDATAPSEVLHWRWLGQAAIRSGKWKYLRAGDTYQYLFDLEADPEEESNLLAQHPDIAADLLARLGAWSNELPTPGLPADVPQIYHDYYDFYFEGVEFPRPDAAPQATPTPSAEAELQLFRQRDADGDGRVTREEWIAKRDFTDAQRRRVLENFRERDLNDDGRWELGEVTGAAATAPPTAAPGPDPRVVFVQRDVDKDGRVTRDEWIAKRELSEAQLVVVLRAFEDRDKDKDGVWALDEID